MRTWLKPQGQAGYVVSFIDILFNQIFVFIVLSIIAFVMVNPPIPSEGVKHQNQFVLTLSWDEGDNDLDFWIRYPNDQVMFYHNKEVGLLNLDRDDLGYENDTVVIDGKTIVNPVNEEIVSIRGIVPGEYIVNIHFYRSLQHKYEPKKIDQPITALVKMDRIVPSLKTVFARRVRFTEGRQEMHIMRFTVNPDGSVADVTTMMPTKLVERNNGAYIEQPQFLDDEAPDQRRQ